jgi:hypothetical protein
LPSFIGLKALKPFISKELAARISEPLKCIPPHGGNPANAVPATVLPEICNAWMEAKDAGKLKGDQIETAKKASILAKGLAWFLSSRLSLVSRALHNKSNLHKKGGKMKKKAKPYYYELPSWLRASPIEKASFEKRRLRDLRKRLKKS